MTIRQGTSDNYTLATANLSPRGYVRAQVPQFCVRVAKWFAVRQEFVLIETGAHRGLYRPRWTIDHIGTGYRAYKTAGRLTTFGDHIRMAKAIATLPVDWSSDKPHVLAMGIQKAAQFLNWAEACIVRRERATHVEWHALVTEAQRRKRR